jgi:hypothetical protein
MKTDLTDAIRAVDVSGDDEFLATVHGRLPEASRSVVERLEAVKSVYVECGRDDLLDDHLKTFVEFMLAKRSGRRDDGRIFFVTEESGAGKTKAVERMLSRHPSLQPIQASFGLVDPVVSVSLAGPTTLRLVGEQIMRAARGFATTKKTQQGEIWNALPLELRHRKVLLVHIDEPQHLLKDTETNLDRKDLAKALKGVMNYPDWPVSFVLSGLPVTDKIAELDEQFERRGMFVRLPDVRMPEELPLVEMIVREMAQAGAIDCRWLLATDMPERIAHAARYRYGRIAQVTLAALQVAFQRNDEELARDHFAAAYLRHSHAIEHDDMNPFLSDDWRNLAPGSFLIEGGGNR